MGQQINQMQTMGSISNNVQSFDKRSRKNSGAIDGTSEQLMTESNSIINKNKVNP